MPSCRLGCPKKLSIQKHTKICTKKRNYNEQQKVRTKAKLILGEQRIKFH